MAITNETLMRLYRLLNLGYKNVYEDFHACLKMAKPTFKILRCLTLPGF